MSQNGYRMAAGEGVCRYAEREGKRAKATLRESVTNRAVESRKFPLPNRSFRPEKRANRKNRRTARKEKGSKNWKFDPGQT